MPTYAANAANSVHKTRELNAAYKQYVQSAVPTNETLMHKILFLLLFLFSAYLEATDSDLDGVDDTYDKCPNTPFSDLVDANGCSIQSVQAATDHYDIILGTGYSDINYASQEKANTTTQTLQADYYSGNILAQVSGSYFKSSSPSSTESGLGDTLLALYVKSTPDNGLTLQSGFGLLLPTYKSGYHNESTDYQASLSFQYTANDSVNIFGGYSYTIVTDKDVPNTVLYQNTQAFYAGAGYNLSDKTTISSSYAQSQSMYVGTVAIKTISANLYYQLNSHWFTMVDYRYGLSDSASKNDGSIRIGYYF
jgi:hypothetical protein